jgi:hypothetical protein
LVSATSDIEIPKYKSHKSTILDFIPENEEETNLSMKLVISEKDKDRSLFNLFS